MANVSDMTQLLSYTTLTLNFLFARLKKKLCERFADCKKLTANLLATPAVPQAFNACVVDTAMNHLIAPQVIQFWEEKAKAYGPGVSGALFGAGWWFWVDACAASSVKIPFVQYLPGFCATLALVMTNCLRREDLEEYDSFDEGVYCRSRSWLFLAYLVSFGSIMGSVAVLLKSYALNDAIDVMWPGVAGLFQVTLILAAGLLLFVSRTPAEGSGSTNYGAF